MPTMNKIDMMDCTKGVHSYEHGGEHGDPCTVCGHTEPYSIGVDVWMAGTIYVDAKDDDEAAAIVAERYAGTRDKINTYDHMSGNDLPMDGDDFMSSAMTIYGLAGDSKLVPETDPVRDAAPDMLAILSKFQEWFGENLDDPDAPLNGADAVDDLCKLWPEIKAAIAKAKGMPA